MGKFLVLAASFVALASALPYTLNPGSTTSPSRTINVATPVRRATGGVVTGSVATPVNDNDGNGAGSDTYTLHTGNGAAGWPNLGQWVNFNSMFNANTALMNQACGNNGWGANDSPTEIANIRTAIENVAAATKVDHRFILAVIMQESGGCVRVPTTTSPDGTVRNPGLMQDHNGASSCSGVNPCPQSTITGMISQGTAGTASGDGLAAILNQVQSQYGVVGAQAFFYAARKYNTGSIPDPNHLGNGGASTACYVSDIANRLTGWTFAAKTCTPQNAGG